MAHLNHGNWSKIDNVFVEKNLPVSTSHISTREAKRIFAKATKQKNKPKPSSATGFG
tara:strand:- start:793 stop:963 length:171 start_codon:yes stop_codon:yes gene_type:complete